MADKTEKLTLSKTEEAMIVRDNEKRIRQMATTFAGRGGSMDDLVQEGRIALLLAARQWRREAAIWTYARRFVLGAMFAMLNKSLAEPLADSDAPELADEGPSPEDELLMRELMSTLSTEEQRVVLGKMVEDLTVRELAEATGTSKSDVDRTWHGAVETMRGRLNEQATQ